MALFPIWVDLMRRQEELRRLEELRNQELVRRKQIEMRCVFHSWVHLKQQEQQFQFM